MARKVVGVGSVGTRAFIVLLQGRDEEDPLFLQVKEATSSVLEDHLPRSRHQPGSRVVHGQRMMQAASDIYLGWTKGVQAGRFLYWRQLRDMKGSAVVEAMVPMGLAFYARQCGWTLARAHARSGDPVAIAAYLGKSDAFEQSMTDFSERLRGSERARLRGLRRGGQVRAAGGGRGRLTLLGRRQRHDRLGQPATTTTLPSFRREADPMSDDIEKTLEDIEALFAQTAREMTSDGDKVTFHGTRLPRSISPTARSAWSDTSRPRSSSRSGAWARTASPPTRRTP